MLNEYKDFLHVDGKWIKNSKGEKIKLRGVCLPDIEAMVKGDRSHGQATTYKDIIDILIKDNWNADVVRLTIHNFIKDEIGEYGWQLHDPDFYYNEYILPVASYLIKNGFYIILDWHLGANLEYNEAYKSVIPFWNFICKTELNNHPQVLFELYNEPKDGTWNDWQSHAQPWINAVRKGEWGKYNFPETPPSDNLILIGGPKWSQILPADDNDKLFPDKNIVYTCHIYPEHCYKNGKVPNWIEYTIKKAPVFLTEWGYVKDNFPSSGPSSRIPDNFCSFFRKYVDSFENLNWTAWCFDYVYRPFMFDIHWNLLGNGKCDTKNILRDKKAGLGWDLTSYPDTYENYMGQFTKEWLNS